MGLLGVGFGGGGVGLWGAWIGDFWWMNGGNDLIALWMSRWAVGEILVCVDLVVWNFLYIFAS